MMMNVVVVVVVVVVSGGGGGYKVFEDDGELQSVKDQANTLKQALERATKLQRSSKDAG